MSASGTGNTSDPERFGQWLSRQRRARDLTQEDLAERVGFSVWSIQKIEVGNRRPSRQMAEILADYFNIPAEEWAAFLQFARGYADAWERLSEPHDSPPPAGTTLSSQPQLSNPNNLPVQLTSFVGRDIELPRVRDLMLTAEVRLLTLVGAPGTGKTRLALQAASELLQLFDGGVFFVNLAPISDHTLVISEIAQSLGLSGSGARSPIEKVDGYLKDKRLVLVLDNFEQVIEAGPGVAEMLMRAASLKVLVTSRVPLHIRGEREFAVPPLQLPDAGHLPPLEMLGRYEAVRLFMERAAGVRDNFELTGDNAAAVAQICAQLDGLPLAIELAAARVKMLSPQTILARLESKLQLLTGGPRDLPARQRTLRSAIEWSYDLLDEEEQKLFRRLSVFVGGLTLESIDVVCNSGRDLNVEVMDGVHSLIDKSLLRPEPAAGAGTEGTGREPRFMMLEILHEYAGEKLEESGEAGQLRRAHALYFMNVAEEAEPHLRGAAQQEWLDRLESEHDNLRSALRWARESAGDEALGIGLRTGGALWQFWAVRGYLSEGWGQLSSLLETPGAARIYAGGQEDGHGLAGYKAKALSGAGILADLLGDYASARLMHEESLALVRELGDKKRIAASLNNLGSVAQQQGDYAAARSMYEESLALKRDLGDKWSVSISLSNLGLVAQQQGDYAAARSMYEESLNLARELGDKGGVAVSLNNLGLAAHLQGEPVAARSLYEESLELKRELGDKRGAAISLCNLGLVALEQRDYTAARAHFVESLTLRKELEDKWGIALSLAGLGGLAVALGSSLASGKSGAGGATAEIEKGVRLLGAVEALLETIGGVLEAEDRVPYERAVASARATLGAEEFERLRAEGRAVSMEQAIEYALEV